MQGLWLAVGGLGLFSLYVWWSAQRARDALEGQLVRLRHEQTRRDSAAVSSSPSDVPAAALQSQLDQYRLLIGASVTQDEAKHLWFLSGGVPSTYRRHPDLIGELRSLNRRGFITKKTELPIAQLPVEFELLDLFSITDLGRALLRCRAELEASDLGASHSEHPGAATG